MRTADTDGVSCVDSGDGVVWYGKEIKAQMEGTEALLILKRCVCHGRSLHNSSHKAVLNRRHSHV